VSDPAPRSVHITTRQGNVRVVGGRDLAVEGGLVDRHDDGSVYVRREPDASEITISCPAGTDVTIGTVGGKVELEGPLGAARVATVSGKIRVDDAASIDVRTKSGSIRVGRCAGECRVVTTSSKVHIGSAGHASVAGVSGVVLIERVDDAEVKTVSGKVVCATAGAGDVSVRTVSGRVEVTVPADVKPQTHLKSVSGKVECSCETGADGEIAVATVSGRITVSCQ
jgi:DUF4097 and DUF4098 domain-containing protein YvlB